MESRSCETPHLPQRRDLLFYCSYTPQKVIWELYYIGGVFFGASSFGRFGRRGKTPNLNQGVFTDTPCVTLSQQESVVASPFALERNHQPSSLMRQRQSDRKRVTPTMTRVFPSLSFASGWTIGGTGFSQRPLALPPRVQIPKYFVNTIKSQSCEP